MYTRIVSDAGVLGGKPAIKGTRISVEFLRDLFASGAPRPEILQAYPHLANEDIEEALRYAADALGHDRVTGWVSWTREVRRARWPPTRAFIRKWALI